MRLIRCFVVSLLPLLFSGAVAAAQSRAVPSVEAWEADLDEIVQDIRLLHPDPFGRIGPTAFKVRVETLRAALPALSDEQRAVRVMQLVALLGDGHSLVELDHPRFARWYPVRIHQFADGAFVTSAHTSVAGLAGARVLEIAGRPADEVLARVASTVSGDNPYAQRERLWPMHNAAVMQGLGYADASGRLVARFRLASGSVVERTLAPVRTNSTSSRYKADDATAEWRFRPEIFGTPLDSDADWITPFAGAPAASFTETSPSRPLHMANRRPFFAKAIPEQSSYYIRTDYVSDTDFIPFIQQAMADVDALRPRNLIVDWRTNFGGDGSKLFQMAEEFIKRSDDRPWTNLFVLTGPRTFSAAIMALDTLLDHVPLTVVGEPSAAGLNHFGDATARPKARTGLRLHVSTLRHQLSASNDLRDFVPVDVPAPMTFADYVNGRDPAVDPILRGDDMRGISMIARADGGAAARAVYAVRKARASRFDWWAPPSEIELRHACDALRGEKRIPEALETCRFNAELHPSVWNVWYNLAAAQRDAGLAADRRASFRCVVALAPDNWNVPAITRFLAQPGNEGTELPAGCPAAASNAAAPAAARAAAADPFRPASIRFGASLADVRAAVAGGCRETRVRRITPPFLVLRDHVKDEQLQLDCDGFLFEGKSRWAEFIFADDALQMVWIMTTPDEAVTLRERMEAAYGKADRQNARFVAFLGERAALRLDVAEVLFYSAALAPQIEGWFATPSTFR